MHRRLLQRPRVCVEVHKRCINYLPFKIGVPVYSNRALIQFPSLLSLFLLPAFDTGGRYPGTFVFWFFYEKAFSLWG